MHETTGHVLFSAEERWLFERLSEVLYDGSSGQAEESEGEGEKAESGEGGETELDWNYIWKLAHSHAVVPLLYPVLEWADKIPDFVRHGICDESRQTVQQSYRLMFLTHYLVEQMEQEGVEVVVLKGVAASGCYPVPELRKSGDVDLLLLDPQKLPEAERILAAAGFQKGEEQHSGYHQVWRTAEGIDVEMHIRLTELFDNRRINDIVQEQFDAMAARVRRETVMGLEFPVLGRGDQAYYLLLHMLHHFLRAGFGLKLLCDWVVFWNRKGTEAVRQYRQRIAETGLEGFSDMITGLCVQFIGLSDEQADKLFTGCLAGQQCDVFMRDILDAGEFGMQEEDRMVIVRGRGLAGYVREFHHQMCLNFPKKSRVPVLWPALWIVTIARFFYNNRKHRGISTLRVLKKAGERGRYMESLRLFQVRRTK